VTGPIAGTLAVAEGDALVHDDTRAAVRHADCLS
jgi:hypothetical protein